MYIPNKELLMNFLQFINSTLPKTYNDMQLLALYKKEKQKIKNLPIIFQEYAFPLKSETGKVPLNSEEYYKNCDIFDSIFDAACLGQYLGGIDKRNGNKGIGFVNESCIFDPSKIDIRWEYDYDNRKIPIIYTSSSKNI